MDESLSQARSVVVASRRSLTQVLSWARARRAGLICAALLGIAIFLFARRLFGERPGVIALAWFTLEPTVLAHGPLVHTDMTSAFALLLLAYAVYIYLSAPSFRRAIYLRAAIGLAPLMKF